MDLYEAMTAENKSLQRAARKLVDSISAQPHVRENLLHEIAAHLDAQEAVRESHIFPILRISADREEIVGQYHARVETVRSRLQELQDLPKDAKEEFHNSAEILYDDIDSMTSWERHEIMPVLREFTADEEAADLGERVRAEQKAVLRQEL